MIKSIYLNNCATYKEKGASIEDCKKINFFYGANGSGKTTISNYLSMQQEAKYKSCKIDWRDKAQSDVVVYNREFRVRHFKEDIEGIFTLGEATIEQINSLDEMKKEREKKQKDYENKSLTLDKKINEEQLCKDKFRDNVWNIILKNNEKDFKNAFEGLRNSKDKFRDEVIKRYKKNNSSSETRETLKKRADTLFSSKPEKCDVIDLSFNMLVEQLEFIENDYIWEKIVVGNKDIPVSKLIDHLNNSDWVNRGIIYINQDGICPFCQEKTITSDLKQQLISFFSGEYENEIHHIKELIKQYRDISEQLVSILIDRLRSDSVVKFGKLDEIKFNSLLENLKVLFSNTIREMSFKEKEVSKKVTIVQSKEKIHELINMLIQANKNIANHNQMVNNYNEEKELLIDSVWEFLICEQDLLVSGYHKDLVNFEKAKKGIQKGIDECEKQIDKLNNKIIEAGKNITSVQPTVNEINRSLKAYGFTNFQIVPSPSEDNYYQIQRLDGTLATNTLSEGEETFISFLYFLQFAKGALDTKKISSKKIMVLDDPISSLDSTILYIVSSMVKSLIREIREDKSDVEQLFILTHNVFFHKEASFIDGRSKEFNDVNYWIISKDNNISSIRSFGMDNPIKTSYELLWQELKTNTNASLVTTQNIMRRIIENYFGILGRKADDTIINSFSAPEDKMICRSLISWINDGSHSIPDDLYIDSYTDSIDRYKRVFKEIFLNMGHEAHYNMMMS